MKITRFELFGAQGIAMMTGIATRLLEVNMEVERGA